MDDEKLKQRVVVILERVTEEEIEYYSRPQRRSRLERRHKTEASKRLRDIERVDFSLFEDYRESRKHYLKKNEKRKRSPKASVNSSKKKDRAGPENQDGTVPTDPSLKPEKRKRKRKHKEKEINTPKPKAKLRRVYMDESDSDNIENYGLFYTEVKTYQEQMNGYQQPSYDFTNIYPYIDQEQALAPVTYSNMLPPTPGDEAFNELDILTALATGAELDFELQNELGSLPNQDAFLSKASDISANDENLSALTTSLIEDMRGKYCSDDIVKELDVVGDILNLMDFPNKIKLPKMTPIRVPLETVTPPPEVKKCDALIQETVVPPVVPNKPLATEVTSPELQLVIRKVVDTLVKRVSARNKRHISINCRQRETAKCIIKKCSLCQHSYTQVENETMCNSCKTCAMEEFSPSSKSPEPEEAAHEKTIEIMPKVTPKSSSPKKASVKQTQDPIFKTRAKFAYWKKTTRSLPSHSYSTRPTQRSFRSTILLSTPLNHSTKKASPIKQKISTSLKKQSSNTSNVKNDSQTKAKLTKARVLRNFPASERNRLLYKNKDGDVKKDTVQNSSRSNMNKTKHKKRNRECHNLTFSEGTTSTDVGVNKTGDDQSQPVGHLGSTTEEDANSEEASEDSQRSKNIKITNVKRGLYLMTFPDPDQDIDLSPMKPVTKNKSVVDSARNNKLPTKESKRRGGKRSSPRKVLGANNAGQAASSEKVPEQSESNVDNTQSLADPNDQSEMPENSVMSPSTDSSNSIVCSYYLPEGPVIRAKYLKDQNVDYHLSNIETIETNVSSNGEAVISKSSLVVTSSASPQVSEALTHSLAPQVITFTPVNSVATLPLIDDVQIPALESESIAENIMTVSSEDICTEDIQAISEEFGLIPSPEDEVGTDEPNLETVPSPKPASKWSSLKIDDSYKSKKQIVILELEAVAILSVIDLEMTPENTRLHIERLLRKEITVLNNLKNVAATAGNEDMAKVLQAKMESCLGRIKCFIFACILWIKCGSLEKVIEQVLSEKISQAITMADKEFESKKYDNDLESWFSRSLAVQAKIEKFQKSDCMFSGSNAPEENRSFSSPVLNYQQNTAQSLNTNIISEMPFIESSLTDAEFDAPTPPFNPKLEVANSCMFDGNTDTSMALVPMNQASNISHNSPVNLDQLNMPSPLQSPSLFNPNMITRITDYAQNLPAGQTFAPETLNQIEACLNNSNLPRMSPAALQSISPRSLNHMDHGLHHSNVPRMSPRTLPSPSSQSFNDLNSFLGQSTISPSRHNSTTSSSELSVPQMSSPVNIKQEKDTRLNQSPCANMSNALVPYGFLPTPSPTPPQHQQYPQTQLQQQPQQQTQLQQHLQLQQCPPPQHQQSALQAQLNSNQLPQLSPQYQNLLRSVRYQLSGIPQSNNAGRLQQLLPALLGQTNSAQRIPAPNKVVPFNSVPTMVNINRNGPISLQLPNTNPNMNRTVPPNISLQFQGSNMGTNKAVPNIALQLRGSNPSVNRTVPTNLAFQLQQSSNANLRVHRAMAQDGNRSANGNFGQLVPVSNSGMVFANQPPQQFLVSGGVPTSGSNQNNFALSYANNMQNSNYGSSQAPTARQPTVSTSNMLLNMLSQPQSNVYAVSTQGSSQNQPPSYASTVQNTQNNLPSQQASDAQKEKQNLMYCAVCSKPATMRCKQCTKVVYCNASCARIYWHQKHKTECKSTS